MPLLPDMDDFEKDFEEHYQTIECGRCNTRYELLKYDQCPHCSNLDEEGLRQLALQKQLDFDDRRSLGVTFTLVSVLILLLLIIYLV